VKNLIAITFCVLLCFFSFNISNANQLEQLVDSLKQQLSLTKGEEKATILSDLCWYQRRLNTDSAWHYGNLALQYAQSIKFKKGEAQAYNDLGIILIDKSAFDSALLYFDKALQIRFLINDSVGIAALYNKIGIVHQQTRNLKQATEAGINALKIFEALEMQKEMAYSYNNLAILHYNQNNYAKSLEYHEKAKTIRLQNNEMYDYAATLGNMAHVYLSMNDTTLAIKNYTEALKILSEFPKDEYYVNVLSALSTLYYQMGKLADALPIAQSAYEMRVLMGNELYLTTSHIMLGNILMELGNLKESKKHLNTALYSAEKLKIKEHLQSVYGALSTWFLKQFKYDSAYYYLKLQSIVKDSILNEDINESIAEMQTKYETEKKENEILFLSKENEIASLKLYKQQTVLYALTALFILSIFLAFVFYTNYKNKQKSLLSEAIIREQKAGLKAIIQATEDERRRIAKDLHDGIGQQLSGLKLAWSNMESELSAEHKEKHKKLSKVLDETCEEVRTISHSMMPRVLIETGLIAALDDMLQKSLGNTSIRYIFEHHNIPERLQENQEIALYRVSQELINNIIKHSNAKNVAVQLIRSSKFISLIVEDDGIGFTYNKANKAGIGLLNINTRLNTLSGEINYQPSPNSGTVATVRIPIG
jgi:two-component system NarL family sensor kinase